MEEKRERTLIGKITHYFNKINVAVVELDSELKIGDRIVVESPNASHSFEQIVESMQIDKKNISEAKKGQAIGLQLKERAREGYKVYRLEEV